MDDLNPAHDAPSSSLDRRTVVKAMAWTAPVIAGVAAAPLAAASNGNATVGITGTATDVVKLKLLDGGVAKASVAVTRPSAFTIYNGPGALSGAAVVTVVVGRPDSGINISVGRAHGFGVEKFNGNASAKGQNTTAYQGGALPYGFPITTFTTSLALNVPSNGSLTVPLEFGLSGVSTGVGLNVVSSFPVLITISIGGKSFSTPGTITVPANAGVL